VLEVQRFAAQGIGSSGAIVPFRQQFIDSPTDTAFYSIVVKVPALGFRDTTYTLQLRQLPARGAR